MAVASSIIAAGIGAAGAVGGASIASSGAKKAANAQAGAAADANQLQWDMYSQSRQDNMPWQQMGVQALNKMGSFYGFSPYTPPAQTPATPAQQTTQPTQGRNPLWRALGERGGVGGMIGLGMDQQQQQQTPIQNAMVGQPQTVSQPAATSTQPTNPLAWVQNMPGYQFGLTQGTNAITSGSAARGMLNSGSTLKALNQFGQDYASTKVGEEWNRLASLAGIGQTATGQNNQLAQGYANQYGNNVMAGANARASAYQNNGATWGNALGQVGGMAANYFNNRPTYGDTGSSISPIYAGLL